MRSHAGVFAAAPLLSYLQDLFTGSNGTAIQSHTMDVGPGWTVLSGSGAIQSNKLQSATSATVMKIYSTGLYSDGAVSVDVTIPASGALFAGLFLRVSDANTAYVVAYQNDGSLFTVSLIKYSGTM